MLQMVTSADVTFQVALLGTASFPCTSVWVSDKNIDILLPYTHNRLRSIQMSTNDVYK